MTLLALRHGAAPQERRRSDAATLLALRCGIHDATLLAHLLALRRCWRCDASFCKSAHGVASRLDTLDVCNALHQGTQGLNDVSLSSCQLGMFILHVVIASF